MNNDLLFGLSYARGEHLVYVDTKDGGTVAKEYRYKLVVLDSEVTIRVRSARFDPTQGIILKDWAGKEHLHIPIADTKQRVGREEKPYRPWRRRQDREPKDIKKRVRVLFCINRKCEFHGKRRNNKLKIHGYYKAGGKEIIRMRCQACRVVASENKIRRHKI